MKNPVRIFLSKIAIFYFCNKLVMKSTTGEIKLLKNSRFWNDSIPNLRCWNRGWSCRLDYPGKIKMCQFPVECIVLCWNCKFYMCALAGSSRLLGSQHVANNKRMKIGPFSYQYWVHVRRYIKTSEFYKIVNTAFHSICFLQHCCINDFLFWLEKEETFLTCYFIELDSI